MITELLIVIIILIFVFLKYNYGYWNRRGVPGPKPTFIFGNLTQSVFLKRSPGEILTDIYKEFSDCPLVGIFRGTTPALMVTTPELIRDITVKDFTYFYDNDMTIDKKLDPIFGRNPFVLKGEEWKIVRSQLTPCFSSGKMKALHPLIDKTSKDMVKFIETESDTLNGKGYDAKELCTRYTLNNVATCAFGLEGKCFQEKDNEFRDIAHRFLNPAGWASVKWFIMGIFPVLFKLISIRFTPIDVETRLLDIVVKTYKYREENNIVCNDFLDIMKKLKGSCKDYDFTNMDVTAHAAGFFGDGFETSSITMHYVLYEIAKNPEAQAKLRKEIQKTLDENNNEFTYDLLQNMPYLDASLNESLRMHPALSVLMKTCTKPYVYTPRDNDKIRKPFTIEKGTSILLPVFGVQNDPQYFENPLSFKPERFLAVNKDQIQKYTYLPFGEGPRGCLGIRFGLLQVKSGIAHIIQHYEISVNKKTKEPLTCDPVYFMNLPVGGIWLNFKKL